MEAVNNQDEAYVEHENVKVLDVGNGCNESSESESELDERPLDAVELYYLPLHLNRFRDFFTIVSRRSSLSS
jgi:hypothetical protein